MDWIVFETVADVEELTLSVRTYISFYKNMLVNVRYENVKKIQQ